MKVREIVAAISMIIILLVEFHTLVKMNEIGYKTKIKHRYDSNKLQERIRVTPRVRKLAKNITDGCKERYNISKFVKGCMYDRVSLWVYKNINYTANTTDFPTPEEVLERGKARCVGKTIIFNSLMQSLGFETQAISQGWVNKSGYRSNHMCSGVVLDGTMKLRGCNGEKILYVE